MTGTSERSVAVLPKRGATDHCDLPAARVESQEGEHSSETRARRQGAASGPTSKARRTYTCWLEDVSLALFLSRCGAKHTSTVSGLSAAQSAPERGGPGLARKETTSVRGIGLGKGTIAEAT